MLLVSMLWVPKCCSSVEEWWSEVLLISWVVVGPNCWWSEVLLTSWVVVGHRFLISSVVGPNPTVVGSVKLCSSSTWSVWEHVLPSSWAADPNHYYYHMPLIPNVGSPRGSKPNLCWSQLVLVPTCVDHNLCRSQLVLIPTCVDHNLCWSQLMVITTCFGP